MKKTLTTCSFAQLQTWVSTPLEALPRESSTCTAALVEVESPIVSS